MGRIGKSDMKMNAIRSGIVVLGAMAFGYLSIRIGFKPYLEKAKAEQHNALQQSDSDSESHSSSISQESFSFPEERHS